MKSSRWRWLSYAALGIVLYVLFLLVFAPATYLTRSVATLSRGAITIQQTQGTIWSGSGNLWLANAADQPLGQLRWTLRPWKILTGSLSAEFQFTSPGTDIRAVAELGMQRHVLRDVVSVVPAATVTQLFPLANALGLNGRVRVNAGMLEITKDSLQGTAEMIWEGAATRLLPINPAGDYKLNFNGQGKRVQIAVTTMQGPLQLTAQGNWNLLEDGAVKLQGTVATSTPQPALEPMLAAIGTPQSDGRRAFTYDARFPTFQPASLFPF